MEELATLVSLEPRPQMVDHVKRVFQIMGVEAPKDKYDDMYELLIDIDKALTEYENKTHQTINNQSVSWGIVQGMFGKKEILKKVLEEKEYHLLGRFRNSDILFDQEICDLYGEDIINYFIDEDNFYYPDLKTNKVFLKKTIELCKRDSKYIMYLIHFEKYIYSDADIEEVCKNHEMIVEYYLDNNVIELLWDNFYWLLNRKEIYEFYVKKVKEDPKYIYYLLESPLLNDYYLEIREEVLKVVGPGKRKMPESLRKNVDFFKDCLNLYDIHNEYFKGFAKLEIIHGVALKKFSFEEVKEIMDYLGLNDTVESFIRKIDYLYKVNDEFMSTLMIKILDGRFNCISLESLERIVTDKDLQGIIIDLKDDKVILVDRLLKKMNRQDIDLSSVIFTVISKLDDCEDENLEFIQLVEKIDINSLTEEQLNNLILVLTKDKNMYKVTSAEDLKEDRFQELRNAYAKSIDEKIEKGTIDIEELKAALFEKKYGLDYTQAVFIYQRYCRYLNAVSIKNPKIRELLISIAKIMREKEIDVLVQLYKMSERIVTDFYSVVALESCIRKEYSREYSDTLFRVGEHPEQLTRRAATYEGEEVEVYDLHGDFRMQVHALGAYTRGEWTRPDDFQEDWNRPKIQSHGVCTSYIGNGQIATARPNGPILGFSSYEDSALLVAGNYDLGSARDNKKYSVSMHRPYRLLPPESMIDFTRHNHNEIVLERRNQRGQSSFKRKPDYIVYIVDDANDPMNFSSDNAYYQQTLQAARDFGIPVIVIDRLAYAKRELKSALEKEKEVYATGNVDLLKEAFMIYANNEVACRVFPEFDSNGVQYMPEPKEYQKIFNANVTKEFIDRVINNVLVSGLSNEQKINVLRRLWVLMHNEHIKFEGVRVSMRIDYSELMGKANSELVNLGSEEIKIGK